MNRQELVKLLLQAASELIAVSGDDFDTGSTGSVDEALPPSKRGRPDRSRHLSHQLLKNKEKLRDRIFDIQRDDQAAKRPERTASEMFKELVNRGATLGDPFVYGDDERQLKQVNRVKSHFARQFGGHKEHPNRFMILKPLPAKTKLQAVA